MNYDTMDSSELNSSVSNATSLDFSYDDDSLQPSNAGSTLSIANNTLPQPPSPPSSPDAISHRSASPTKFPHGSNADEYIPVTSHVFKFAMCAAMNSCNLGFDIGVNTSAGPLLQQSEALQLSDLQLEILMGSLNMFAAVGAICASSISDRFGRRGGFIVAAVGFILGVLIMTLAQSFGTLMFGRVFVGLGVGFGLAIDPIYIAEISPPSQRGRLVTWSEIATNVGIVLGFSSGLIFYNVEPDLAWRLMFGMGIILPTCLIYLVWKVMPESPRWLVSKGREPEAFLILSKVYPPGKILVATNTMRTTLTHPPMSC
jgi:MFS family permease